MSRYAVHLAKAARDLSAVTRGYAVLVVPATEQLVLAAELAEQLGRPLRTLCGDLAQLPGNVVVFPQDASRVTLPESLRALGDQRQRFSEQQGIVLVLSNSEVELLRQYTPDVWSVVSSHVRIPFVPRPVSAAERANARAELRDHYRRRFGRLDLRGFIRSEIEDSSFSVEDIIQPLSARSSLGVGRSPHGPPTGYLSDLLESYQQPALIIGPPGSGKSFFLRWCAMHGAEDKQFLGIDEPVPIYVPLAALGTLGEVEALVEFLQNQLLEEKLLAAHLLVPENESVLMLLDGIDEAGDEAGRRRVADAITSAIARFPSWRFIASSRRSGLDGLELPLHELSIEPLDSDGITRLLERWCVLYETQRRGGIDGLSRGLADGRGLAAEVVASPALSDLASTPLLATIIAIVHRAGVQLPDHRVELYERMVQILVERWNQVRSEVARPVPPIRVSDTLRLLSPIALQMIESGSGGVVSETWLSEAIEDALKTYPVRALSSSSEAFRTFRQSLGLLVERAPHTYGFLHQSLLEYLAAHELVRTDKLEELCKNARSVFRPDWRETILLALGIIGHLRADDHRLRFVVSTLLQSARRRPGRPASTVPSLLAGIVVDDPALTSRLADELIEELIPKWWYDRQYGTSGTLSVVSESLSLGRRILSGPWADQLRSRLQVVGAGSLLRAAIAQSSHSPGDITDPVLDLLMDAGIEIAPLLCEMALGPGGLWIVVFRNIQPMEDTRRFRADIKITRGVADMMSREELRGLWKATVFQRHTAHKSAVSVDATSLEVLGETGANMIAAVLPVAFEVNGDLVREQPVFGSIAFNPRHITSDQRGLLEQLRKRWSQ